MDDKKNIPNEGSENTDAKIKEMESEIINRKKEEEIPQEKPKENEPLNTPHKEEVKETPSEEEDLQEQPDISNEDPASPETEETPKENKQKGSKTKTMVIVTLVVCIVLSSILGIGGGVLGYNLAKRKIVNPLQITSSTKDSSNQTPKTNVAEVVNNVADSVVEITTEVASTDSRFRQYVTEGAGSGVIISADGYIATNNHVIDGAQKITVKLRNGQSFEGKLISTDSKTDIALVKIEATGLTAAVFGDSDSLQVGECAIAIGNPLGELGGTVTEGIISSLNRDISIDGEVMNLLQTNAAINPGNSGGGLFNSDGELIGLVVAKSSGTGIEGLGFAIPSNEVKSITQELNTYGYIRGRVDLQMTLVEVTTMQQAIMYGVPDMGVYISKVDSGSAAESAGFKQADKIIAVNSQAVSSATDFQAIEDKLKVGENAKFTVVRNGQQMDIDLTLQEYKPSF